MQIFSLERQFFYRTGMLGLRALDARGLGTQRFTPDGDARWKAFRGELTDSDRLDLLLRDAAVLHPSVFSAAAVFGLPDLAADEPFGPDWVSLLPSEAGLLLREASVPLASPSSKRDASPSGVLLTAANMWGLTPRPMNATAVLPASRALVAGAGAIIALADHMAGRGDMDFSDQLLLVTDLPAERQLFGLAAALCGSRKRPRMIRPAASLADLKTLRFERPNLASTSDDAAAAARHAVARILQELELAP